MMKYAAPVGAFGGSSCDHGWAISSSPALYSWAWAKHAGSNSAAMTMNLFNMAVLQNDLKRRSNAGTNQTRGEARGLRLGHCWRGVGVCSKEGATLRLLSYRAKYSCGECP